MKVKHRKPILIVGATTDGNDVHYHSPELPSEFYSIFDPNSEFTYNGEFSTRESAENYLRNHYDKN